MHIYAPSLLECMAQKLTTCPQEQTNADPALTSISRRRNLEKTISHFKKNTSHILDSLSSWPYKSRRFQKAKWTRLPNNHVMLTFPPTNHSRFGGHAMETAKPAIILLQCYHLKTKLAKWKQNHRNHLLKQLEKCAMSVTRGNFTNRQLEIFILLSELCQKCCY